MQAVRRPRSVGLALALLALLVLLIRAFIAQPPPEPYLSEARTVTVTLPPLGTEAARLADAYRGRAKACGIRTAPPAVGAVSFRAAIYTCGSSSSAAAANKGEHTRCPMWPLFQSRGTAEHALGICMHLQVLHVHVAACTCV